MASLVEQLAQHIDWEIVRDLKVFKMLLEISQELYVSMNTRKKLIHEFKEKVGSMVDMTSIRFLDGLQYREMNMCVDTLKHVNEVHAHLLERSNFMKMKKCGLAVVPIVASVVGLQKQVVNNRFKQKYKPT
ncbi:hypothetical protein Tco_1227070 [Tanacetum coccineum]